MKQLTTLHWEEHIGSGSHPSVNRHLLQGDYEPHDHDFMELVVVLNGRGSHTVLRNSMTLGQGAAFLIRPGNWHKYHACDGLELMNFCFPLALVRSEWRYLLDERTRSLLRSGEDLQLAYLSGAAIDALNRLEEIERGPCGSLGLLVWALDQFAAAAPPKISVFHPAVEIAICALEEEPGSDWTVDALARVVGLDRAYLSRLFKRSVGVGPMAYLAILRAEKAASLLRNSSLNCGEVGIAVGYADPNLFSRRFRARFGTSPSDYRATKSRRG